VVDNTHKLRLWRDAFMDSDRNTVLMDCDTIVRSDLSEVFDDFDFDVAYTVRDSHFRINAGVVFLRPTDAARAWVQAWCDANDRIAGSPSAAAMAMTIHGGINQAAIHDVLGDARIKAQTVELPCALWNCCQEDWHRFHDEVAVLHVKGELRDICLHHQRKFRDCRPELQAAVMAWLEYGGDGAPAPHVLEEAVA